MSHSAFRITISCHNCLKMIFETRKRVQWECQKNKNKGFSMAAQKLVKCAQIHHIAFLNANMQQRQVIFYLNGLWKKKKKSFVAFINYALNESLFLCLCQGKPYPHLTWQHFQQTQDPTWPWAEGSRHEKLLNEWMIENIWDHDLFHDIQWHRD